MNNIERVSIPMRDLCLDPCLSPTQLKEHTVEHTFDKAMLTLEAGVNTVNSLVLEGGNNLNPYARFRTSGQSLKPAGCFKTKRQLTVSD